MTRTNILPGEFHNSLGSLSTSPIPRFYGGDSALIFKQHVGAALSAQGKFVRIPNELFERGDVTADARLIWCYLMSKKQAWKSSRNNIARNLGIDTKTVSKCINQLERANMLKVDRHRKRAWDFHLIQPSDWLQTGGKIPQLHGLAGGKIPQYRGVESLRSGGNFPHTKEEEDLKTGSLSKLSGFRIGTPSAPLEWGARSADDVENEKKVDAERLRKTIERVMSEANGLKPTPGESN